MESVILQPLLQVLLEKLSSPVLAELRAFKNLKEDIRNLQNQLLMMQTNIEIAEDLQGGFRGSLLEIQSAAYDADNLLDTLNTIALHKRVNKKASFLNLQTIRERSRISHKLKGVRNLIEKVIENSPLNFCYSIVDHNHGRQINFEHRRQTGHCVDESIVYLRQKDVENMVKMLVTSLPSSSTSSRTGLQIIPVVGIGPIGKTTLAKLAYKDSRIDQHFDLKLWISLDGEYDAKRVMNDILENGNSETNSRYELSQVSVLQSRLQEWLRGKRFLLVLDDLWNVNQGHWDDLKIPLCSGAAGSKVIVTTRSRYVASLVGTEPAYDLQPLTDDDCWILLKQYAFAQGEEEEAHPNIISLGKEIAGKCAGVPLTAKVIGSRLRSQRDAMQWQRVLEDVWILRGIMQRSDQPVWEDVSHWDAGILRAIYLSYNILPPHQKCCFLYCSVFPKNYLMSREKVIQQWIAAGLVEVSGKRTEDFADDYFNDLVSMSLLEVVSKSDDGKVKEFKLHDLIHYFAQRVSGTQPLNDCNGSNEYGKEMSFTLSSSQRHASMDTTSLISPDIFCTNRVSPLRIFHLLSLGNPSTKAIRSLCTGLRELRVLNLSGCGLANLHKSVGKMIFLRYLDISGTCVQKLPETICHLINLQTLNLSACRSLRKLPNEISNLINLRHLNISDCVSLTRMPPNIGWLRNLQTLPIFLVGHSFEESLLQLAPLELRGELKIKQIENSNLRDFCLRGMQLHSLLLSWGQDNEGKVDNRSSRQTVQRHQAVDPHLVLNCLAPNHDLRNLSIKGYPGSCYPNWMNKLDLPKLTKLSLIDCKECQNLPELGELQFLKVLSMQGMDAIVNIGRKFYGKDVKMKPFPSLTELILKDIPNLKSWESMESMETFPCLNKLSITNCPKLTSMPWFPCLNLLELHKCNAELLQSAKELNSLSTIVMDVFPERFFVPEALLLNNSSLTSLTISSCPNLGSIPPTLCALTALQSLHIRWCKELEALPSQLCCLTSLQTLEIVECPRLCFLPEESMEGLKSLRSLSIERCSDFRTLPTTIEHLTALERLALMYCPNLECLPDGIQHLQALRSVSILSCPKLVTLPVGLQHVDTLENLEIHGCSSLMELPNWIENLVSLRSLAISDCENVKSLPEGLKDLTALQCLSISDCPDLLRRCQRDGGEDWHKIVRIPYLHVGTPASRQQQGGASSSSI